MSNFQDVPVVYTIGHSNHSAASFVALLERAGVTAVADVRSVPFSRFSPQFNKPELKATLAARGIAYSFLGKELGARPSDPACYRNGTAAYDLIAASVTFQQGLDRVLEGAKRYRIALMCAEKDPLDCHRNILVARNLARRGTHIFHILATGRIEDNAEMERRLMKLTKQEMSDMFESSTCDPLDYAYEKRSTEIAYSEQLGHEQKDPSS